jgi:hypothetical protein
MSWRWQVVEPVAFGCYPSDQLEQGASGRGGEDWVVLWKLDS